MYLRQTKSLLSFSAILQLVNLPQSRSTLRISSSKFTSISLTCLKYNPQTEITSSQGSGIVWFDWKRFCRNRIHSTPQSVKNNLCTGPMFGILMGHVQQDPINCWVLSLQVRHKWINGTSIGWRTTSTYLHDNVIPRWYLAARCPAWRGCRVFPKQILEHDGEHSSQFQIRDQWEDRRILDYSGYIPERIQRQIQNQSSRLWGGTEILCS